MESHPPILGYATPPHSAGRLAVAPKWVVILVAVLVPGLASCLIRGRDGLVTLLLLLITIPLAFFFFGPIWGEVLFRNTRWSEAGLYPFLLTCVAVSLASAAVALRDRRRALGAIRGGVQM